MKTFLSADRRFLNPQAMENVELKAAVPAKDTENNPLFTQDMPWEIRIDNGYPNVIYDRREQIFHCYYTLFTAVSYTHLDVYKRQRILSAMRKPP